MFKHLQNLDGGQLRNGILLNAAEVNGFDVMITADQNLQYQQNLKTRKIALVVIGSNRWPYVQQHLPAIRTAVEASGPSTYIFIEVPLSPKPKPKLQGQS